MHITFNNSENTRLNFDIYIYINIVCLAAYNKKKLGRNLLKKKRKTSISQFL